MFYFYDEKDFLIASELKAIRSAVKSLDINTDAVGTFLHLGYLPNHSTFFKNCYKFPAGHYGIYSKGKLSLHNYWNVEQKVERTVVTDEKTAKSKLKELVYNSVSYRMISDVPLGTFLSGGIDSSLVTSVAQAISPKPVKSFSIGFKESKFDESLYARKVAKHLGTDHHEYILSEKQAREEVNRLLEVYDEPFADSSAISTLLVSEMARKEVTVCLSGDGGDELFLGYGMYNWASRLDTPFVSTFRKPISWALSTFGSNRMQRGARVIDFNDRGNIKSHIFSQEQYFFSRKEINYLLQARQTVQIDESVKVKRNLSKKEEQSIFDIKNYLKDDLLMKVDRASMKHSLEVRVPLLDHNIVEFALNLDEGLKEKNGVTKYLLKQLLYDHVPKEYFDRPKWGFGVPVGKWLKNDLKFLVDNYLSPSVIEGVGLMSYKKVEDLKNQFYNGKDFLYNRIWSLTLLHRFLLEN